MVKQAEILHEASLKNSDSTLENAGYVQRTESMLAATASLQMRADADILWLTAIKERYGNVLVRRVLRNGDCDYEIINEIFKHN